MVEFYVSTLVWDLDEMHTRGGMWVASKMMKWVVMSLGTCFGMIFWKGELRLFWKPTWRICLVVVSFQIFVCSKQAQRIPNSELQAQHQKPEMIEAVRKGTWHAYSMCINTGSSVSRISPRKRTLSMWLHVYIYSGAVSVKPIKQIVSR